MDIKHERGGDMVIGLNHADIDFMGTEGYCMTRFGLCGSDTKTWVRNDMPTQEPTAQIDGASDVTVYLPAQSQLPIDVETANIDPYMDNDRGRVDFYFGETGRIIVRLAE